jgi:hypothetical protein
MAVETSPITYQWQFNGTNIADATNGTLVLSNLQVSDNGAYACVVSNGAGIVTSHPALVQVLTAPVVVLQPQAQEVGAGVNATFVGAARGPEPLSYQWQKIGA